MFTRSVVNEYINEFRLNRMSGLRCLFASSEIVIIKIFWPSFLLAMESGLISEWYFGYDMSLIGPLSNQRNFLERAVIFWNSYCSPESVTVWVLHFCGYLMLPLTTVFCLFVWFLNTLCIVFNVRLCPQSFLLKMCNRFCPVSFTSSLSQAGGFSESSVTHLFLLLISIFSLSDLFIPNTSTSYCICIRKHCDYNCLLSP